MKYTQTILVTLGISTILASPPQPENDSSAIKRFKRQCSTYPVYNVSCHGLCPQSKDDRDRNAKNLSCGEGQHYHCAREAKTGELTEACAAPVYCGRGKEPRIQFQPGNVKIAEINCTYCDDDRYHPFEERRSDTFPRCLRNRTVCTPGQVECDVVSGVERTWTNTKCTCDARNGFWPPEMGTIPNLCTSEFHVCAKWPKCTDPDEELLQKDFTCGRKCDKGFARIGLSDDCVPVIAEVAVMPNITEDINATSATTPNPTVSLSVSTASTTRETTSSENEAPAGPQNSDDGKMVFVFVIAAVVPAAVLVMIVISVVGCLKTKKKPECTTSYLKQILCWCTCTCTCTRHTSSRTRRNDHAAEEDAESIEMETFLEEYAGPSANHNLNSENIEQSRSDSTSAEKKKVIYMTTADLKLVLDTKLTVDYIKKKELPFNELRIKDMSDLAKGNRESEATEFILDQLLKNIYLYNDFKDLLKESKQNEAYKLLFKAEAVVVRQRTVTETNVDDEADHEPTLPVTLDFSAEDEVQETTEATAADPSSPVPIQDPEAL